jgi:hypothetical protein
LPEFSVSAKNEIEIKFSALHEGSDLGIGANNIVTIKGCDNRRGMVWMNWIY